jgi:hypothetical protein
MVGRGSHASWRFQRSSRWLVPDRTARPRNAPSLGPRCAPLWLGEAPTRPGDFDGAIGASSQIVLLGLKARRALVPRCATARRAFRPSGTMSSFRTALSAKHLRSFGSLALPFIRGLALSTFRSRPQSILRTKRLYPLTFFWLTFQLTLEGKWLPGCC